MLIPNKELIKRIRHKLKRKGFSQFEIEFEIQEYIRQCKKPIGKPFKYCD